MRVAVRHALVLCLSLAGCDRSSESSSPPAPTPEKPVALEGGTFPEAWIDGSDCASEPKVQVHAFNDDVFILRQSLCTNVEAPFLYLIFGEDKVLLQDTGAKGAPIREVVDGVIEQWLAAHDREQIELLVTHSHAHWDHNANDDAFADRPHTRIAGPTPEEVQQFFGIRDWPTQAVELDLGDRVLDVLAIPGHELAHVALYDRRTGLLLTGDSLYPGRLYFLEPELPTFAASIQRLQAFAAGTESGSPRRISHVLGTHIEMTTEPGVALKPSIPTHENEHRLELSVEHLRELADALATMNGVPKRDVHDDFILYPVAPEPEANPG